MNKKDTSEKVLARVYNKTKRFESARLFVHDLLNVLLNTSVVALSVYPIVQMSDDVCVSVTLVFCALKCLTYEFNRFR